MKTALRRLKIILKTVIGLPIYYISIFFPKKKGLIVIGSSLGKYFADNSKYFYLKYYNRDKSGLNLIWLTKSRDVVRELNSKGLPVKFLYSFGGAYTALRASKAYLSHQLDDINGALIGGAKIVQLWHGMPLRKIGYGGDWMDDNLSGKVKLFISKWLPYAYYMKCDVLMAPSKRAKDNYVEPFSKSFRNNKIEDNIVLSQQPRTFCFEETFELSETFFPEKKMLLELRSKYKCIISWLPTQRKQFNKTIIDVIKDSGLNMKKMDAFCRKTNSIFVIKAHFLDFDLLKGITKGFNNILIYPNSDPYPLLKFTDVLITDYSSVFFDFLLLDRPIIFMCHDLEEYTNKAQFYYDFETLEIGPICRSWKSTIKVISNISEDNDDFAKKRNNKFNMFGFVEYFDTV
ncbi:MULTISPECIES: CDP-glycerol glycerophosphotransferase family protein [Hwangdonia]|uniref:CDP-glycerol glycerophosphotransferase family protein n=1 Tax=Hwangdonia seohaensis TaxID=1240727 RepID=A0ABW3R899_9FLAO|nr:CDP-glycerol glycerophosphotransferase family protein [Hwangdonia seohaensis]